MDTRAVYTFKDIDDTFHVYQHCDGDPFGALHAITESLTLAWELPRFEADEFGASFIAANKCRRGSIRLCHSYEDFADLEFRYEITLKNGSLNIVVYKRIREGSTVDDDEKIEFKMIFSGLLDEFELIVKLSSLLYTFILKRKAPQAKALDGSLLVEKAFTCYERFFKSIQESSP